LLAVSLASAQDRGDGYRGGEWATGSRAHFGWCMA
jgi:hypothetical protein